MIKFASIHNHDQFSLLDGLNNAKEYIDGCIKRDICGFGITNHGNTSSVLDYYTYGKKIGFPVMLGEEFYIEVIARNEGDKLNLQWEPSQLSSDQLEDATKSISSKMILEDKVEAKDPPKIPDQPEDKMSDEEDNYMIKHLTRIP